MHLGLVFGDLDAAIQAMHSHLRRSVFMPQARGRGGWLESGIGPEVEITVEQVNHAIDAAAEIGAEVFFIDASWYAPPKSNWWKTVGDWEVDRQRFPQGLKPFRDRVHAAGMLWGLWMDAERIGEESRVAKEHPEWLAMNYDGERQMGGQVDLTNPQAAQWMEKQIVRVLEENQLDFFRLDYNTHPGRGIRTLHDGFIERWHAGHLRAVPTFGAHSAGVSSAATGARRVTALSGDMGQFRRDVCGGRLHVNEAGYHGAPRRPADLGAASV
jgi:alpha-galactosidase